MGKMQFKFEGTKELNREIRKAKKKLEHSELEDVFEQGADMMTQEAKSRAPVDDGTLRDAVETKKMGDDPLVFISAVNRGKAPHANILENGTGPRYHESTGKYVGSINANPFWRPAWDNVNSRIEDHIIRELRRRVEKAGGE